MCTKWRSAATLSCGTPWAPSPLAHAHATAHMYVHTTRPETDSSCMASSREEACAIVAADRCCITRYSNLNEGQVQEKWKIALQVDAVLNWPLACCRQL